MSVDMTGTEEYWQQTPDGTIVLGGGRAAAHNKDIGVRISQPTEEVQGVLEGVFPRLFPELSGLKVERFHENPVHDNSCLSSRAFEDMLAVCPPPISSLKGSE